jgi:hypothetical protein
VQFCCCRGPVSNPRSPRVDPAPAHGRVCAAGQPRKIRPAVDKPATRDSTPCASLPRLVVSARDLQPVGRQGNEADLFGCSLDAGRHRRPGVKLWHGLEFAKPRRSRLHDEQRNLCGTARRNQSQRHAARQLQRNRQRESVHRRRRHAESAVLTWQSRRRKSRLTRRQRDRRTFG